MGSFLGKLVVEESVRDWTAWTLNEHQNDRVDSLAGTELVCIPGKKEFYPNFVVPHFVSGIPLSATPHKKELPSQVFLGHSEITCCRRRHKMVSSFVPGRPIFALL